MVTGERVYEKKLINLPDPFKICAILVKVEVTSGDLPKSDSDPRQPGCEVLRD